MCKAQWLNLLLPLHFNYSRLISSHFTGSETEAHRSSVTWPMLSSSALSPTWFSLKSEKIKYWSPHPLSIKGFPGRQLTCAGKPSVEFLLYPEPLFTHLSFLLGHGHLEIMSNYLSASLKLLLGDSPNCMLKTYAWVDDLMSANACRLITPVENKGPETVKNLPKL